MSTSTRTEGGHSRTYLLLKFCKSTGGHRFWCGDFVARDHLLVFVKESFSRVGLLALGLDVGYYSYISTTISYLVTGLALCARAVVGVICRLFVGGSKL